MKKGFTLVELIAVIVVLGLVLSLIGISVDNNIKENRQKLLLVQKEEIIKSAKAYVTESSIDLLPSYTNKYSFIEIDKLIREGFLKSDNYKDGKYYVVNPVNEKPLIGGVCITYDKKYNQYQYNFVENEDSCENMLLKENSFIVRYDSKGGSECPVQYVEFGKTYESLCNTARFGYVFDGWYLEESNNSGIGERVIESMQVNKDHMLYAKWLKNSYILILEKDETTILQVGLSSTGCVQKEDKTYMCSGEIPVVLSADPKPGYENPKWSGIELDNNNSFTLSMENVMTKDITLKLSASATPKTYIVELDNQGATTPGTEKIEVTYNSAVLKESEKITVPTRIGYKFNGYYTAAGGTGIKYINDDGTSNKIWDQIDVTKLYAYWTANKIYVYYNTNGGTWNTIKNENVDNSAFNHDSAGYVTKNGSRLVSVYNYDTNVNLVDYNGGYINTTKTGYKATTNAEWNSQSAGNGVSFNQATGATNANNLCDATEGDCEATLYVNWTPTKIYVKYHINGGTWNAEKVTNTAISYNSAGYVTKNGSTIIGTYSYGQTGIDLVNYNGSNINVFKTGYQAKSGAQWNTASDGKGTSFSQAAGVTDANDLCIATNDDCTVTLYVNWRINNVYVQYHMNGGTWAGSTNTALSYSGSYVTRNGANTINTYTYGQTGIDLPNYDNANAINITRNGYAAKTGAEWNLKADGTGTSFTDSSATINANDLCSAANGDCTATLYVNWTPTRLYLFKNGEIDEYTWTRGYTNTGNGNNTVTASKGTTLFIQIKDTTDQWGASTLWYTAVKGEVLKKYAKANITVKSSSGSNYNKYLVLYASAPTTKDLASVTGSINYVLFGSNGNYLNLKKTNTTSATTIQIDSSKTYYIGYEHYATGAGKETNSTSISEIYLEN